MRIRVPIALSALVLVLACAAPKATPRTEEPSVLAQQYVSLLAAGDFEAATGYYSRAMRSALPAGKLRATWRATVEKVGPFQKQVGTRLEKVKVYDIVLVRTQFERDVLNLKVVFNADREIDGFFYTPADATPSSPSAVAPVEADPAATARGFVAQLAAGEFAAAASRMDDQMRAALPPEKLSKLWTSVQAEQGAFKGQLGVVAEEQGEYTILLVGCDFERQPLDLKVVVRRADNLVAGLFAQARYAPAPYANREAFVEREVTVGGEPWKLPGTLTLPKGAGPFPVLVLVHGSGPNDRDETIGPNKPFRDLAEGLASRGIAVLRYDKRTLVYRGRLGELKGQTVKDEAIDDALAAVALLKATPEIDPRKVFVLGHSLGGMLAPRIGKADASVAGLVLMAGAARPMHEVIVEQVTYLTSKGGAVPEEAQKEIEQLRRDAKRISEASFTADSPEMIQGIPASYWVDLRDYDAPVLAAKLRQPILVLQGERDYQVTMADLAQWKRALGAKKSATFKTYPKLNHLFTEGEGPSRPEEYSVAQHIPEYVLGDLAAWMKRQ